MDITKSLENLKNYIEKEDFKGYDPYDALNSPILNFFLFNHKYPRIVFMQALKRLPVNLRPFFGIKKDYNPKGLGLFLWGYAKLFKIQNKSEYLDKIHLLLGLLDRFKSKGYSGNCWGYNFDWQSRAFFVPKYTPTIVGSSFIGHALIDTYRYAGIEKALDMAVSIKDFILNDLNRTEFKDTFCFSYTPIDKTIVHNANLLGASLLIRLYGYTRDEALKDAALASLEYSMLHQKKDGSWLYANTQYQKWIDSFHTGFNLQCIRYFFEEGFAEGHIEGFEKGVKFYKDNFFLENGLPKYYHDRVYPIDIHSPAQAIVFFSKQGKSYKEFTEKITAWMIKNMQDEEGFFYFQIHKRYKNRIPYMRWGQAWAFHALTSFLLHK